MARRSRPAASPIPRSARRRTGTLTNTDVDDAPNTFTSISSPTTSTGGFGAFTMTANGVWAYTINQTNSAVQALNVGDTLTDPFMATTIGGTPQAATNGNSAAVISGTTTGSVLEAGGTSPDTPPRPALSTDVDKTPSTFTTVGSPAASESGYGTFTMTAAGVWTYTLDNANSTVDALGVGDTLNDTFTVPTVDGTAQVVTITIHGSSDADPNDSTAWPRGRRKYPIRGSSTGRLKTTVSREGVTRVKSSMEAPVMTPSMAPVTVTFTMTQIKGITVEMTRFTEARETIQSTAIMATIRSSVDLVRTTSAGGNGDDRFVYSSAADSHAGQFDAISDFKSGCDKINLTAFGALASHNLALTSESTAVPAHTVAGL